MFTCFQSETKRKDRFFRGCSHQAKGSAFETFRNATHLFPKGRFLGGAIHLVNTKGQPCFGVPHHVLGPQNNPKANQTQAQPIPTPFGRDSPLATNSKAARPQQHQQRDARGRAAGVPEAEHLPQHLLRGRVRALEDENRHGAARLALGWRQVCNLRD